MLEALPCGFGNAKALICGQGGKKAKIAANILNKRAEFGRAKVEATA